MATKHNCLLCAEQNLSQAFSWQQICFFHCEHCGLLFKDPKSLPSATEEKNRYDQHKNDLQDERYIQFLQRLSNKLLPYLEPQHRGLDFGCGPSTGYQYIMTQEHIDCASYDPFYYPHNTLLERTYDFILCSEVVEHFHQPAQSWGLLFELLSKQTTPLNNQRAKHSTTSYLGVMTQEYEKLEDCPHWYYIQDPTHVVFYQRKTMLYLAEKYSCHLINQDKNIFLFAKET